MIKSWQHKGLEAFFLSGSKAGIRPDHAPRLGRQLARLDLASAPLDMNVPGWRFHQLEGSLVGHYAVSVSVNGNWRLPFRFDGPDAVLVDY
ncbi:type II toxin-antitoxin system RelE/ParE family toxin [Burkholderia ubonensis]|uniref:type II toxin-antitoxin system RelE/ParE family toxin n=1 Tax=Burkholderia ubonensis TaxID=101571 RepID=UPI000755FB20|nr:type II toxin-antitoxin system RelE/ParE family toxin [Burkholderia ubonensis]KWB42938.1 Killer protein [Burkholderia ubonensis]